jgi:hypothetical protein
MRQTIARSARLRGVVVLVTAAMVLGGFAVVSGRASSAPSLADVSARQLLSRAIHALSGDPTISGNVATHIDLGLPDLPDEGAAAATGPAATLISSLSGDHRLRVWHSPDGARVSDLLPVAERSIIVSRTDAWLWDSAQMTAVHLGPFGRAPRRPPTEWPPPPRWSIPWRSPIEPCGRSRRRPRLRSRERHRWPAATPTP